MKYTYECLDCGTKEFEGCKEHPDALCILCEGDNFQELNPDGTWKEGCKDCEKDPIYEEKIVKFCMVHQQAPQMKSCLESVKAWMIHTEHLLPETQELEEISGQIQEILDNFTICNTVKSPKKKTRNNKKTF